jgi:hypothetical protein
MSQLGWWMLGLAGLVVLAAVAYGFASRGPFSFRARYRREVESRLAGATPSTLVTEEDVGRLPGPVQRYLRLTGAVGQPLPRHFRASWRGRIRASPTEPWMAFTAEQHNFVDEPSRFFLMDARRGGLPVDVLHSYRRDGASMRVRLLSLIPMVDASGPDLRRAETVTVFNDLCLLAPGALVDPSIRWEEIDASKVRAHYTTGPDTISAVLVFNDAGELVDFVSDDRLASRDGKDFEPRRWSTPVSRYRNVGATRVMTRGEGRWHTRDGDFAYIELELLDLAVDGATVT